MSAIHPRNLEQGWWLFSAARDGSPFLWFSGEFAVRQAGMPGGSVV